MKCASQGGQWRNSEIAFDATVQGVLLQMKDLQYRDHENWLGGVFKVFTKWLICDWIALDGCS